MTNPDYTHIAVVLDRSGSMASIKNDMVGGLNAFFAEQAKEPGTCLVDLVQFDDQYEVVFADKPVADATADLQPRGSTALLDAIGKTVTRLGEKLAKKSEDERPGKVMVVVVTDGYENASCDWTKDNVKKSIETQTNEFNWDFVFLGTNFDAVAVGQSFGFQRDKSLTFANDKADVSMATLNTYATNYRAAGAAAFTEEDRIANA